MPLFYYVASGITVAAPVVYALAYSGVDLILERRY